MILYCKDTGEECIDIIEPKYKCLIHGWQTLEHFEVETNTKVCEVCGRGFYCTDEIRKVCSMDCAKEYATNL